jgi:hypothetical protein
MHEPPSRPQVSSRFRCALGRRDATLSRAVISSFFGIYVRMYFDDHPPPHVHVEYQGHEAFVAIQTGDVLEGSRISGADDD